MESYLAFGTNASINLLLFDNFDKPAVETARIQQKYNLEHAFQIKQIALLWINPAYPPVAHFQQHLHVLFCQCTYQMVVVGKP